MDEHGRIKRKKSKGFIKSIVIFLLAVYGFYTVYEEEILEYIDLATQTKEEIIENDKEGNIDLDKVIKDDIPNENSGPKLDEAKITFIDIGQGDAILIQFDKEVILLDTGLYGSRNNLIKTLDDYGIKKIDHLIASHPHADHIGTMPYVIDNYDIGKFYMSDVSKNIPTTVVFTKMLESLDAKKIDITIPKAYDYLFKKDHVYLKLINDPKATGDASSRNLNEYSLALEFKYGDTNVLLTGDGETLVEKDIVKNNKPFKVNVMKAGHHGSSTSNSEALLDLVQPEHFVIQAGLDNQYGHPHQETIKKLNDRKIEIHENTKEGNITFVTNGKDIRKEP